MSFVRRISPMLFEYHVGSSGAEGWIWIPRQRVWSLIRPLLRRSKVTTSDHPTLKDIFHLEKTGSLENNPRLSPTVFFLASDHPTLKPFFILVQQWLWRMLRVFVRRCLSHVGSSGCFCRLVRPLGCRIIRTHCIFLFPCCICPTRHSGHLDTPNIFSLFFHCDLISIRWIGHLVSTVHWTSRLDGALDVSSRRCIGHLVYCLDSIQGI